MRFSLSEAPKAHCPTKFLETLENLHAMDMQQGDFDRILFFEHARKTSEATYAKNPLDADVRKSPFCWDLSSLICWGFL